MKRPSPWTFPTALRRAPPRRAATTTYIALALLVFAWEAWWAPATPLPRIFWIGLKVVPLMVPFPWLLRGSAYAYTLAALLLLVYLCDGVALAYGAARSDTPAGLVYATGEILLALLFIASASLYVRITFQTQTPRSGVGTEP